MKFTAAILLLLFLSCSAKQDQDLNLYLHTLTVDSDNRKDTVAIVDAEYLEMTRSSRTMQNGDKDYMAHKVLTSPHDSDEFHLKEAYLVSELDSSMQYDSKGFLIRSLRQYGGTDRLGKVTSSSQNDDYTYENDRVIKDAAQWNDNGTDRSYITHYL